jgi:hypothetical protein
MLFHPSVANPTTVSIVTIAHNGPIVLFRDRRGGLRLPPTPGLTRRQIDSVVVAFLRSEPRTTITLNYRTGQAFVLNEGANLPPDGFSVPIHVIARDPRYGSPDTRARAIVARCR